MCWSHLESLTDAGRPGDGHGAEPPGTTARPAPTSFAEAGDLVVEPAAGLVGLVAHAADHDQRRVRRRRHPSISRCVRVAGSPQTMQIAVSFVTWSARASSRGIAPNGMPRKSRSSPVTMTCLPARASALDDLGQPLVEELALLDRDDVGRPTAASISAECRP